jgi:hypothetical protein
VASAEFPLDSKSGSQIEKRISNTKTDLELKDSRTRTEPRVAARLKHAVCIITYRNDLVVLCESILSRPGSLFMLPTGTP